MNTGEILIVDDELGIRELLSEILQDEGYQVRAVENAQGAREYRNRQRPDLVLLDIWMPDCDGITLLKEWARAGQLTMPVVMMSGHATIDTAVEATRIGALDFMEKPVALQKLLATVHRALKLGAARTHPETSLASLGKGEAVLDLKNRLDQILKQSRPILLNGEFGVAFEPCARYLASPQTPWITVDNSQLLIDAPLTLLEEAKDGLLFVSEVGDLPKRAQQGLLLAIQKAEKFHVRIVATTTRPLLPLVSDRQFDSSLYQQLCGLVITIPSLRAHQEDIPDLANQYLALLIEAKHARSLRFTTAALNRLRLHPWYGNHLELQQVVQSLATTSSGEEINEHDVDTLVKGVTLQKPPSLTTGSEEPHRVISTAGVSFDQPLRDARDAFERAYLEYYVRKTGGNMSQVAEQVGLERTHLYRKLKQLGISVQRRGSASS